MEPLEAYYRLPHVRTRIAEYCGGVPEEPDAFSALCLAGYGGRRRLTEPDGGPVPTENARFEALLEDGADVCRSLADREGTLLLLDIDYVNPQAPSEPYLRPEATFSLLEPVYHAVCEGFAGCGIAPLALMTGRGYHFVARVPFGSALHEALVEIGSLGRSLAARYAALESHGVKQAVLLGRAHEGAGRLLEFLAHGVAHRLQGRTEVPLSLADVPPPGGGPFVCLDLTPYADPLHERHARCAFSGNQKALMKGIAPQSAFVISLPRGNRSLRTLLRSRENPERAAALAAREHTRIPTAPGEELTWVRRYCASGLACFHQSFDRGPLVDVSCWPYTYDILDLRALPACARIPLESPNPLLLMPAHIRSVALALWGLGWHPRSVAGLVRSRYEKDHGWGPYWLRYDPGSRADFYVRLFCAAVAEGLDGPASFTCESQRLRGVCPESRCGYELDRLLPTVSRPAPGSTAGSTAP